MSLFNLSALTRHTDYSSAFVLCVAIRKSHVYYAYRVLAWLESIFHILQGTPARQPRAQLLHGRRGANTRGQSWQCPWLAAHSQPHPTASPLFWRLEQVEGPHSWPFPAQLHKVNETCRGIAAGDGATRALQSITSGVQRLLPPPSAFASHSLIRSRISDSSLQRARTRTVEEE